MKLLCRYVLFVFLCYYLISIISCKRSNGHDSHSLSYTDTLLPPDFIDFYKRFHQDTAYQLDHVVFPLPGVTQDTAGQDSVMTWTVENWKFHQQIVQDEMWSVDFTIPLKGIVVEFVHAREEGFWMERRFARMDTTWRLIYYEGLRMD